MDKQDQKLLGRVVKHFEKFYASEKLEEILDNFTSLCQLIDLQPGNFVNFYHKLKPMVKSAQAQNLFKLLDEKTKNPVYSDNMGAANIKMTVVGSGPVGLRTAIEAQLLGAKVTVIEKRKSFTRNNVLHLWQWVIEDLKTLGAKNFFPRFCTGTMNHISIWRLQCILLKTALCFGVEIICGIEFKDIVEPKTSSDPWRISVKPEDHPLSSRAVDVLIGAEGKHVSVPGFRRKEFRGKLAIAITANFSNKRTTAEAVVDEISGVAFVYKQDFFNTLYDEFGIALENIVYYKDDTHYFVMCTKKHSLLDRKVLKKDINDPIALLSPKNINKDALLEYIRDACDYCTDYQLPHLEFALNHYGQPDVALFDFTSMFASGNACHVIEKNNKQLLVGLVGDGLLEPFWPTGTGIPRGFLGAFDTVWMVRQWASGDLSPTEVIAERESILKLLPQTTAENITKDFKNVSIVPKTRYPNLPKNLYSSHQVVHLYQTDSPGHADLPRYSHPGFEEVVSRRQLQNSNSDRQSINYRIERDPFEVAIEPSKAQKASDAIANANDFYQAMRDKRKSDLENGNEKSGVEKGNFISGNTSQNPSPAKAPLTLKERVEARRAALSLETEEGKKKEEKSILKDKARQAEFVKKMSKTFGYGMPSNAETKPDTLTEEAEKCALLVRSSNNRPKELREAKAKEMKEAKVKEVKAKEAKKAREVKKEARRAKPQGSRPEMERERPHSSVAPIVPEIDIEIDPELDFLLSQLEQDNDFSELGENDQKAWLESLFFQDTTHLPGRLGKGDIVNPRDQLSKSKSRPKPTLRLNQDGGGKKTISHQSEERDSTTSETERSTAVHVNDKMKDLAVDFFKEPSSTTSSARKLSQPSPSHSRKSSCNSFSTPPTSRKASVCEPPTKTSSIIEESCEEISGINQNLCCLAQSYFQTPTVPSRTSVAKEKEQENVVETVEDVASKVEDEKINLVASFFSSAGGSKAGNKKQTVERRTSVKSVPERVAFEPQENEKEKEEDEDEDEEIERLIRAARKEMEEGPPIPPRRVENKALSMMKCLNNVSGILQGKKS